MKFDPDKLKNWAMSKESHLPGLQSLFESVQSEALIIGAAVFELYEIQNWIPCFKRKTGDIDLSIGIVGDDKVYVSSQKLLLELQYKPDSYHPYRYDSPRKVPGGYTYIDLLAHPLDANTSSQVAVQAMGVGPDFGFNAIPFAQVNSFPLQDRIVFPNPLAMILLKQEGYLANPTGRVKDFADLVELMSGLVEKGSHFDLESLWRRVSGTPEARLLIERLRLILSEDPRWDLDDVRHDLRERGWDDSFLDEDVPLRIRDFCEILVQGCFFSETRGTLSRAVNHTVK